MKCSLCGKNFDGDKVLERMTRKYFPKEVARAEKKGRKFKVCHRCISKMYLDLVGRCGY